MLERLPVRPQQLEMNNPAASRGVVHWGWEIDHIKPVSKGGTDDLSNLQPLQWENNRHKGDDWPGFTCKVKN